MNRGIGPAFGAGIMAIPPQLQCPAMKKRRRKVRRKNKTQSKQRVNEFSQEKGEGSEKGTFAAKFAPQSNGYKGSYQVGQPQMRERGTPDGEVNTFYSVILGGT